MIVDAIASQDNYWAHLEPIWNALPDDCKGDVRRAGRVEEPVKRNRVVMVASWRDMAPLRGQAPFVYVEHGAGQSYGGGDGRSAHYPDYSASRGGRHHNVLGYICPNQRVADLWRRPGVETAVVGSPRLDALLALRVPSKAKMVCFNFHWPCLVAPESRSAFDHFDWLLPEIVTEFNSQGWATVAHVHEKWDGAIDGRLQACGLTMVNNSAALTAEVLVCDNSSTAYESSALGRQVISLNAPWYRRDVHHGLRFWDAVPGMQVDDAHALIKVRLDKVAKDEAIRAKCEQSARAAYTHLDGHSAQRAADAIVGWIS